MKRLLLKYQHFLLYTLFGGLTTAVDLIVYYILYNLFAVHYLAAQTVSWVVAVLFAYFTNKRYVFASKVRGRAMLVEMFKFVSGRLFSFGVQTVCLALLVEVAHWDENIVRLPVLVIVTILNYVVSRVLVFDRQRNAEPQDKECKDCQ